MKALYKITFNCIKKLYLGIDYVENYKFITFSDGDRIFRSQIDDMLVHWEDGIVIFTYDKNLIHKHQRTIKKFLEN